jgi:hypothetical protein
VNTAIALNGLRVAIERSLLDQFWWFGTAVMVAPGVII